MATQALTSARVYVAGYDLSGNANSVALDYAAEMLDATTFDSGGTRESKGGLKNVNANVEGLWDAPQPDKAIFDNIGVSDVPVSFAVSDTEGDRGFTFLADLAEYSPGASIGELLRFSTTAEATGDLVRGDLLFNKTGLSSSGNGTAFQAGAVTASQTMYAALHVFGVGTGSVDFVLASAATQGGAYTDRITFTQATGVTSEWKSVDGAITDSWWRAEYTIAGGAPSVSAALVIGIL